MDQGIDPVAIATLKQIQSTLAGIQKALDTLNTNTVAQTSVLNSVLPTVQTLATTAGSASGKYANTTFNGAPYKINLLNP